MLLLHLALAKETQNHPHYLTHDMPELPFLMAGRSSKRSGDTCANAAASGLYSRILFRGSASTSGMESRVCWRWVAFGLASHCACLKYACWSVKSVQEIKRVLVSCDKWCVRPSVRSNSTGKLFIAHAANRATIDCPLRLPAKVVCSSADCDSLPCNEK